MLRLVAVPAASLAAAAPIGLSKVYAAEKETSDSEVTRYKPSQLPIYGDPPQTEYEFIPEEETAFSRGVTSFRKSLWTFMDTFHDTSDTAKDKLGIAKAHSGDLLRYIQEDAGVVPKAVIITVAGLGGIVAGYRSRYLRKGVYASIGMVTAASICYPHQAVDITQYGWSRFKRDVLQMKQTESEPVEKVEQSSKDQDTTVKETDATQTKTTTAEPEKDYGQSKAEDKDMYTTRGS